MHILYDIADTVTAFTAGKGCHGTEPGIDARQVGVVFPSPNPAPSISPLSIFIPRQTHSVNVVWAEGPGEAPDSDAVITRVPGLCVAVKTADCIPVLLYDERQGFVAAVHAGWRGTVGRIVSRTIEEMQSRGQDLHAVIGPGISLASFEVGDEVYDAFREAGFPMDRIARRFLLSNSQTSIQNSQSSATASQLSTCASELSIVNYQLSINATKWHLDLWEANRWLLEQAGVTRIHVDGTDTMTSAGFYSARRDTIKTGRNINGIMLT